MMPCMQKNAMLSLIFGRLVSHIGDQTAVPGQL
jgi:hypothetical protein